MVLLLCNIPRYVTSQVLQPKSLNKRFRGRHMFFSVQRNITFVTMDIVSLDTFTCIAIDKLVQVLMMNRTNERGILFWLQMFVFSTSSASCVCVYSNVPHTRTHPPPPTYNHFNNHFHTFLFKSNAAAAAEVNNTFIGKKLSILNFGIVIKRN